MSAWQEHTMDELFDDIVAQVHQTGALDAAALDRIITAHNKRARTATRAFAKKHLHPYFLRIKTQEPERWHAWNLTDEEEAIIVAAIRMKPRRTQSGVATITVITKPWTCAGDCRYCPNDVRMPKSYLADEPACQRAERNFFDPYLQVISRLTALTQMGHATDKVELIVLGGTFADYPTEYQIWFVRELFRALNDFDSDGGAGIEGRQKYFAEQYQLIAEMNPSHNEDSLHSAESIHPHVENRQSSGERRQFYEELGLSADPAACAERVHATQEAVSNGTRSFNEAIGELYLRNPAWQQASQSQTATLDQLEREQLRNEAAAHRNVGLVIETRPDTISPVSLRLFRQLGCTKVQIGVQGIRQELLDANGRSIPLARIQQAFELLRLFGFKTHAHFMVNLLDATAESDLKDFISFVEDAPWQPDEIKLYPCALIAGTQLERDWQNGAWRPYDEETLVDLLAQCVIATPSQTRISRMIRDFSSGNIVAGNKKTNLRQLVEQQVESSGAHVREIRYREIANLEYDPDDLQLEVIPYETTNTQEFFLQWITPDKHIAGFLRLSLPFAKGLESQTSEGSMQASIDDDSLMHPADEDPTLNHASELPVHAGEAMIREVHVYGRVARLNREDAATQHQGLGSQLIEKACEIARNAGFTRINVISAVGTRAYYRNRNFIDNGLYQQRVLS